jgi:hypothetical protein
MEGGTYTVGSVEIASRREYRIVFPPPTEGRIKDHSIGFPAYSTSHVHVGHLVIDYSLGRSGGGLVSDEIQHISQMEFVHLLMDAPLLFYHIFSTTVIIELNISFSR